MAAPHSLTLQQASIFNSNPGAPDWDHLYLYGAADNLLYSLDRNQTITFTTATIVYARTFNNPNFRRLTFPQDLVATVGSTASFDMTLNHETVTLVVLGRDPVTYNLVDAADPDDAAKYSAN